MRQRHCLPGIEGVFKKQPGIVTFIHYFKEVSDEQNSLSGSFIIGCLRVQRLRDHFQGRQQQVGIDIQSTGRDRLCKRGGDMFQHAMRR
jgi:hypothetical protein